jgi:mannose-6-phosphate isomerase-like protein (cupin superfamily)
MQQVPPIWPIQGKVWGTTQCIFKTDATEAWFINAKKGGYCSEHFHKHKWNRFFVIKGKMNIKIFRNDNDEDLIDQTTLGPGQSTDVQPGVFHIFEALEDCQALEIYWVSLDPDDIERRTHGGMRDS